MRGLWPRLITALIALAAMGALWLIDTAALLMLARSLVLAHPWEAAAVVGVLAALLALAVWRERPKPPRRRTAPRRTAKIAPPRD
jgi:membrane protein implicated in regulation of membrane protease activity